MSDRIAVMNAGNVEQIGTPTEIYDRPSTVFVANFIGQANLWLGKQTGRVNRELRRGRGARHQTFPARPGDTTIESGGQATLMVRPERRPGVDGCAHRRRRGRAGHGHRPDLPGSGGAAVAGRRRRLPDRRAHRTGRGPADAAARRSGVRQLGAGAPRWCCRPPTSPPPRISRRCSTTPEPPCAPTRRPPHSLGFERQSSPWPKNSDIDPRSAGPTRRQSRPPDGGSSAEAPPPRPRWCSGVPSWPRVAPDERVEQQQYARPRPRPTTAHRPAAICASRTGRCTWPTASSPPSRPPAA